MSVKYIPNIIRIIDPSVKYLDNFDKNDQNVDNSFFIDFNRFEAQKIDRDRNKDRKKIRNIRVLTHRQIQYRNHIFWNNMQYATTNRELN